MREQRKRRFTTRKTRRRQTGDGSLLRVLQVAATGAERMPPGPLPLVVGLDVVSFGALVVVVVHARARQRRVKSSDFGHW